MRRHDGCCCTSITSNVRTLRCATACECGTSSLLAFLRGGPAGPMSPDYSRTVPLFHALNQFYAPSADGLGIPEIVSAVFFGMFNQIVCGIAIGDVATDAIRTNLKAAGTKLARTIRGMGDQNPRGGTRNQLSKVAQAARRFFTWTFLSG